MQPAANPYDSRIPGALELGRGALVSRVLGFARDAAIAALLGGGWAADAFLIAFRLPNFTRRLLAEGAFAYALVPGYQAAKQRGPDSAATFARTVTVVLAGFFLLFSLAGVIFSRPAALVLAPGLAHAPQTLAAAAIFLALCLPYLPMAAGAAVTAATLMAEGSFRAPAYAPALLNVTIIAFAGLAFLVCGPGGDSAAYVLCAGIVAAGAVQWGVQLRALARKGFPLAGPLRFRDRNLGATLRALPPSAFGAAGNQVNILVAAILASFLAEGSISALYFAERLIEFPLGIIGTAVGLATLTNMSRPLPDRSFAGTPAGKNAALQAGLDRAARLALFLSLPAAVGTACLAAPVTALIFGHGEFGAEPLARTSAALLAYTAGLPALAAARPFLAAYGALRDAQTPLKSALLGLAATIVLGGPALFLGAAWALALAVSFAAWINLIHLGHVLARRGVWPVPPAIWLLKTGLANGIMAGCVLWAKSVCATDVAAVLVCIPLGILVYFAAAFALRLEECGPVRELIIRAPRKPR